MDSTEQIARQYLLHQGFSEIVYEPDGNIPPDFLIDRRIAIEVRRLNQHEEISGHSRGLEVTEMPLLDRIRNLLRSFGPPPNGVSWFVMYQYQRPLESWKTLKPKLEQWLSAFQYSPPVAHARAVFGPNFSLSLIRASRPQNNLYLLGGFSDYDSGGWLLAKMEKNIQICVDEKTRKIASVRHKYREWWLILVDHIGHGLSELEQSIFRDRVNIRHDWDRLVLVSPLDHTRTFDI